MRNIAKAIGGTGLTISGALMLTLATMGLDWDRIAEYGILNEISLCGMFITLVFAAGVAFLIMGVFMIGLGAFGGGKEDIEIVEIEECETEN